MNRYWLAIGLMAPMLELAVVSGWMQQRIGPLPHGAEPAPCEVSAARRSAFEAASIMDTSAALACALRRRR